MATFYSNNYSNNGATGPSSYNALLSDNNQRHGEAIWIRAVVNIPATAVATDIAVLAPLVPGCRPVMGAFVTASATNGSMTVSLGYESAPTAILSASTAFQAAGQTALTATQINAVTALTAKGTESGQDRLILTLGGTVSNATTIGVWIPFVNFAA